MTTFFRNVGLIFCGLMWVIWPSFAQEIDSTYTVPPPPDYVYPYATPDKSGEEVVEAAAFELSFDTAFAMPIEEALHEYDFIPTIPDALIADRLTCLENEVPLHFHPRVRLFIDFFSVRRRAYTLRIMQRKNVYFPMFERILAEYGMPDELKYLSIIESALIPNALSRAGARGLWQFMPATGRMYGLTINYYVDERMNPEKSTRAACQYLKALHKMFGDWELAIAAYNCGPGNVRKAMRRTGKFHFWDIYHRLPRETRSYLPQFVSMLYVLNHAEDHNLIQEQPYYPIPASEVYVSQSVDLDKLAKAINVCEDDLRVMNPELRFGILPSYAKNYPLQIPGARLMYFNAHREEVLEKVRYTGRSSKYATKGKSYYYHLVRRGENLGLIAQRNGVRLSQLRAWNNIYSNRIYPGQKLRIYGPKSKVKAQKAKENSQEKAKVVKTDAGDVIYTVRSGDTLWDIARKFEGLTVSQIKSRNNLRSSGLQPGQKLNLGKVKSTSVF